MRDILKFTKIFNQAGIENYYYKHHWQIEGSQDIIVPSGEQKITLHFDWLGSFKWLDVYGLNKGKITSHEYRGVKEQDDNEHDLDFFLRKLPLAKIDGFIKGFAYENIGDALTLGPPFMVIKRGWPGYGCRFQFHPTSGNLEKVETFTE